MNELKEDKRVEKTRKAIMDAFLSMILEKDLKDITIKDLALRANISRKTFYLHYLSKDEIIYDITLELSDKLYDILKENKFFDNNDSDILVNSVEKMLNDNSELIKVLVSSSSYLFIARNIKNFVKDMFINKLKKKIDMDPYLFDIVGDSVASGMAKLLKDWFINKGGYNSKQIAMVAVTLVYSGVSGIYKSKDKLKEIKGD